MIKIDLRESIDGAYATTEKRDHPLTLARMVRTTCTTIQGQPTIQCHGVLCDRPQKRCHSQQDEEEDGC